MIAYILIIAIAPILLWVIAEVLNTRTWIRILSGFLAMGIIALFIHWITIFTPTHEQALTRFSMRQLEDKLKSGNTNLVCNAIAEFNRVAATGNTYNAMASLTEKLENEKIDGESGRGE